MKYSFSLGVLCLATTLFLTTACEHQDPLKEGSPRDLPEIEVTVDTVTPMPAPQQAEVVGTVQPLRKADVSAKITGNIITLPVNLGTRVAAGDLLAELAADEIAAQVQQAKAQLEQTRRNLARERSLLKQKAATPESVKSLEDAEKIAEAAYLEAQTMEQYRRIQAPFGGIITRKYADVGDLASPGKILMLLEEEHELQIVSAIPERMMLEINIGDILPIIIPSVNVRLDAEVTEISPTADPNSRSVPIRLNLPANPKLRSGQFARVQLTRDTTATLTVDPAAVIADGQMQKVFVVTDDHATLRLVRTGAEVEDRLEILSGLEENERVVVSGNHQLTDNQRIIITNPQ